MSRIYELRGALPPDPGRSGKRPKAPRKRWTRPDVPRPEAPRRRGLAAELRQPATAGEGESA